MTQSSVLQIVSLTGGKKFQTHPPKYAIRVITELLILSSKISILKLDLINILYSTLHVMPPEGGKLLLHAGTFLLSIFITHVLWLQ